MESSIWNSLRDEISRDCGGTSRNSMSIRMSPSFLTSTKPTHSYPVSVLNAGSRYVLVPIRLFSPVPHMLLKLYSHVSDRTSAHVIGLPDSKCFFNSADATGRRVRRAHRGTSKRCGRCTCDDNWRRLRLKRPPTRTSILGLKLKTPCAGRVGGFISTARTY